MVENWTTQEGMGGKEERGRVEAVDAKELWSNVYEEEREERREGGRLRMLR